MVVESGEERYRRYIIEEMRAAGRGLVYASVEAPTWQVSLVDAHLTLPDLGAAGLRTALTAARRRRVAGVFTYIEKALPLVAALTAALGLPGPTARAAALCLDKPAQRRHLASCRVPVPRFEVTRKIAGIAAAAARVGYPCVLKAQRGTGSAGVVLARDPAELPAATGLLLESPGAREASGFLVEEYLDGPEVSVQAICADGGQVRALAVTDKETGPLPFFQKVCLVAPSRLDPARRTAAVALAERALDALGVGSAAAFVEVKFGRGGPRVIEAGPRIEGDRIPQLNRLATGLDIVGGAVALALGASSAASAGEPAGGPAAATGAVAPAAGGASLCFMFPATAGVIAGFAGVDAARAISGVCEVDLTPVGTALRLPPAAYVDRAAFAVARGSTPDAARDAARAAVGAMRLDLSPLPG
jgi:biotin carboxylase